MERAWKTRDFEHSEKKHLIKMTGSMAGFSLNARPFIRGRISDRLTHANLWSNRWGGKQEIRAKNIFFEPLTSILVQPMKR